MPTPEGIDRQQIDALLHEFGIAAYDLPLPPLTHQTSVVVEVERRLRRVKGSEVAVPVNLRRALRLWRSILLKTFAANL